jgi:hypothetical protein
MYSVGLHVHCSTIDIMHRIGVHNTYIFFNTTMILYLKEIEGRKHATGSR